jgi:diphosphomevalonate decarboxylase
METSKATSPLLKFRAEHVVQARLEQLEQAVLAKDFQTFGLLTMQDSNQFHATCLDTYPPIFYMNDISKAIMRLVHVLNENAGKIIAAYTYDAGPNAVIYTLDEYVPLIVAVMGFYFPSPGDIKDYCNNTTVFSECTRCAPGGKNSLISSKLATKLDATGNIYNIYIYIYIYIHI